MSLLHSKDEYKKARQEDLEKLIIEVSKQYNSKKEVLSNFIFNELKDSDFMLKLLIHLIKNTKPDDNDNDIGDFIGKCMELLDDQENHSFK